MISKISVLEHQFISGNGFSTILSKDLGSGFKGQSNQCFSLFFIQSPKQYINCLQMIGGYQSMWKAIIRPPKAEYTISQLGPNVFRKRGIKIIRTDIQIINKMGLKLQCSHFEPYIKPAKQLPCVIYLHGNSSCRLEALRIVDYVLSRDVTLFCFDFAGCGLSEGPYISLGYYEKDDVDCIFQYLRKLGTVSSIGIWGRSMGAVTALMYADSNHEIACLVLDSPFSNLEVLCKELADKHAGKLSIFSGIALSMIKSTIKDKHGFNIEDIDPIGKHVKKAFIPAFFIHGKEDDFIVPVHSQMLYEAYAGEKRIRLIKGDHNDQRPETINEQVSNFFYYGLGVQDYVQCDKQYMEQQKKQKEEFKELQKKVQIDFNQNIFQQKSQEEEQEEMLKQVIALSLAQSEKAQKQKHPQPKQQNRDQ